MKNPRFPIALLLLTSCTLATTSLAKPEVLAENPEIYNRVSEIEQKLDSQLAALAAVELELKIRDAATAQVAADLAARRSDLNTELQTYKTANFGTSKPKVVKAQSAGSVLKVLATAYTADCATGCTGITATGLDVRSETPKIIAVDPDIIPLHAQVELFAGQKSLGIYSTQDTGGDIKGFRIDVLMPTVEAAKEFGEQELTVKIIN